MTVSPVESCCRENPHGLGARGGGGGGSAGRPRAAADRTEGRVTMLRISRHVRGTRLASAMAAASPTLRPEVSPSSCDPADVPRVPEGASDAGRECACSECADSRDACAEDGLDSMLSSMPNTRVVSTSPVHSEAPASDVRGEAPSASTVDRSSLRGAEPRLSNAPPELTRSGEGENAWFRRRARVGLRAGVPHLPGRAGRRRVLAEASALEMASAPGPDSTTGTRTGTKSGDAQFRRPFQLLASGEQPRGIAALLHCLLTCAAASLRLDAGSEQPLRHDEACEALRKSSSVAKCFSSSASCACGGSGAAGRRGDADRAAAASLRGGALQGSPVA